MLDFTKNYICKEHFVKHHTIFVGNTNNINTQGGERRRDREQQQEKNTEPTSHSQKRIMSNRRSEDNSRNNGTTNSDDPPMSRKNLILHFHIFIVVVVRNGFLRQLQASILITLEQLPFAIGLFIICNKQNTEEDFRDAFQKFGKIEEIYTIKDRNTGDNKGKSFLLSNI